MFALRPAQRIAIVVQRTGLAAGRSAADVGNDVVSEERLRWKERNTVVGGKCGPGGLTNGVRSPDRRPAVVPVFSGPYAEFVDDGRRQRRNQRSRNHTRRAPHRSVVAAGPVGDARLSGLRPVAFPRSAEESLVARAEIVIDTDVVLVSIRVVAVSVRAVLPLNSAEPAIPGYIQPVARAGCRHEDQTRPARGEIVRRR